VYVVEYRTPSLAASGKPEKPLRWIEQPVSKTLYDPAQVSDAEYLEWAQEAMSNARLLPSFPNIYEGIADNGVKFQGIVKDGQFDTVYAVK